MNLIIDKSKLAGIVKEANIKVVNSVYDQIEKKNFIKFNKDFLEELAPRVQVQLRSATNLPTREGKKEFYDNESRQARQSKGWRTKGNDEHLLNMWEVGVQSGRDKRGRFVKGAITIENPKMVYSKNKSFNLFKLLWEGTQTYVIARSLSEGQRKVLYRTVNRHKYFQYVKNAERDQAQARRQYLRDVEQEAFATRGRFNKVPEEKQWQKEIRGVEAGSTGYAGDIKVKEHRVNLYEQSRDKEAKAEGNQGKYKGSKTPTFDSKAMGVTGLPFNEWLKKEAPKPMRFYDRFKGKFYWNRFMRKGIEGDVVKSFHGYIGDCVLIGLREAQAEIDEMKVLEAIGQERFV